MRLSSCIFVVLLFPPPSLAQHGANSPLLLKTSDPAVQLAFDWAKAQALAYVAPRGDPVGDWYEAALPGRHAFCMRDLAHQTMGAYALGFAAQNRNMIRRFAESISDSRDWAGFWEIDRNGQPSTADYRSDDDFWYNLPANFDVMIAALRMYGWTGDPTYIDDPAFTNFYERTVSDYPNRWSLEPPACLARKRIMNRRVSEGEFVEARGIPSYSEGRRDFVLGLDLVAAEYRALWAAADLARSQNENKAAKKYELRAKALQHFIEAKSWNAEDQRFYGFLRSDRSFFGEGDAFILYFSASKDPIKVQGALAAIKVEIGSKAPNIEEQSYYPEILYKYGAAEAAFDQILDLSRVDRERRDYPEVSYSIIGAIVTGMMGVDVASSTRPGPSYRAQGNTVVRTRSQIPSRSRWVELDHLPVRGNVIDIRHDGKNSSTLTNVSGPALVWRPSFEGRLHFVMVDGRKTTSVITTDDQHRPTTTASILVPPKSRMVVTMVGGVR